MLDATDLIPTNTIYRATDPIQSVYRALLAGYTDTQLMRLEDEISNYSSTGLLPESLRSLILAAEPAEH